MTSISYVRTDAYYDLHVPGEQHYLADGRWSHNTGKSRAVLEKVHMMMLVNPGARALLVRKTMVSLADAALQTWKKFVVAEALSNGSVVYYGGSKQEPAQYKYSNGSAVMLGGMDNPTKVMSTEYDLVYVQEAIELSVEDWESLLTRLRNNVVSFQQLIADTNPDTPFHWLKQRVDRGDVTMIDTRHEDNPTLYDADTGERTPLGVRYIGQLDKLTGTRKDRLRYGKWVSAEGTVYDEFDPVKHLIDPFDVPASWTRWWTVDFGYVNPFVLQWWAEDGDGRLFLYRELYMSQRLVEDHARQAMGIVAPSWRARTGGVDGSLPSDDEWVEPQPRAVICDHDAEARATLEKYLGMGTLPANKTVDDGIQYVKERLRGDDLGRPRLFIMKGCTVEEDLKMAAAGRPTSTAQEALSYVWKPPTKAKPDGQPKDEPEKENDHGMDAMRYLVIERSFGAVTTRMLD